MIRIGTLRGQSLSDDEIQSGVGEIADALASDPAGRFEVREYASTVEASRPPFERGDVPGVDDALARRLPDAHDVDVWLLPARRNDLGELSAPSVIVAPELNFVDLPIHFADQAHAERLQMLQSVFDGASHILTRSPHSRRRHLTQRFGVLPEKITVFDRSSVPLQELLAVERSEAAHLLAMEAGHPLVLRGSERQIVLGSLRQGRFSNGANFLRAAEALGIGSARGPGLILLVENDDGERARWVAELEREGLHDAIVAPLSMKHLALSVATVMIRPAFAEHGFPAILEDAVTSGLATLMPAVEDVLVPCQGLPHGEAILFDPFSQGSMKSALRKALADPTTVHGVGAALLAQRRRRSDDEVARIFISASRIRDRNHVASSGSEQVRPSDA